MKRVFIFGFLAFQLTGATWWQTQAQKQRRATSAAAWNVINTKCVRCHGGDITPDVSLVGGLDLRTRASILAGGNRGPAMTPGTANTSLIYLFVSLWTKNTPLFSSFPGLLSYPPTVAFVEDLNNLDARTSALGYGYAELMPPFNSLQVGEVNAIRLWIAAGAP